MTRRFALRLLIALQLLAALAWPAHARAIDDTQHRMEHALLAQHHHDESIAHHHGHTDDALLSLADAAAETLNPAAPEIALDHHHHHDVNTSMALPPCDAKSATSTHPVQNPRILPAMLSAELRAQLRPPQA